MAGTQLCTKCGFEKSSGDFSWKNKKKLKRRSMCKACHSAYRRQHYLDNIGKYKEKARRWNDENKADRLLVARRLVFDHFLIHPCVDCGEADPVVLEFDHVRGEKYKTVSELMTGDYALFTLQREIDKCEVRCANCHRRKTARERGWHILDLMAEYNKKD